MAPELERQLAEYHPCCEQEAVDRDVMLHFLRENTDAFTLENLVPHFTASSWIVNSSRTHALMAWHNLYRAWRDVYKRQAGNRAVLPKILKQKCFIPPPAKQAPYR